MHSQAAEIMFSENEKKSCKQVVGDFENWNKAKLIATKASARISGVPRAARSAIKLRGYSETNMV